MVKNVQLFAFCIYAAIWKFYFEIFLAKYLSENYKIRAAKH